MKLIFVSLLLLGSCSTPTVYDSASDCVEYLENIGDIRSMSFVQHKTCEGVTMPREPRPIVK